MANSVSWLRDDFGDSSIAPSWTTIPTAQGSATHAETGGQLRITLPSSTAGTHESGIITTAAYDLTGAGFYINIGTMVSTGVAAVASFEMRPVSDDLNNILQWYQQSNSVKARKIVGGVSTELFTATWSSSTYKYLRIRESGGTIYFDSSSNGTAWTNRASTTVASTFAVTSLYIQLSAQCGNVASPGSFRLDDVNLILPALATTWHYFNADWQRRERIRSITISATSGQGYIATSDDLATWRFFSGPLGSSSGGYNQLVEYAAQADAQAMAVNLPNDGRWDLPGGVDCRYVRLYDRSVTGSTYRVDEFYPRRLVQSDDIEAESIRAINIAAGSITADKITSLTITGKQIRTAISGARAVMSGEDFGGFIGYGASDTYDPVAGTGTYQVLWSKADGSLYAGGGNTVLDDDGIWMVYPVFATGGSAPPTRTIKWKQDAAASAAATIGATFDSSFVPSRKRLYLEATGSNSYIEVTAGTGINLTVGSATINMTASGSSATLSGISTLTAGTANVTGGINLGSGSGAGTGQISASGNAAFGDNAQGNIRVFIKAVDTGTTNYAIYADDSAGSDLFYIRNDGTGFLKAAAWVYGSDRKLKRNIRPLESRIAALRALQPKRFDYINGPQNEMGFVAQDIQTVLPELVEVVDESGTLGLKTTNLIPVIVQAIQDIYSKLEAKP